MLRVRYAQSVPRRRPAALKGAVAAMGAAVRDERRPALPVGLDGLRRSGGEAAKVSSGWSRGRQALRCWERQRQAATHRCIGVRRRLVGAQAAVGPPQLARPVVPHPAAPHSRVCVSAAALATSLQQHSPSPFLVVASQLGCCSSILWTDTPHALRGSWSRIGSGHSVTRAAMRRWGSCSSSSARSPDSLLHGWPLAQGWPVRRRHSPGSSPLGHIQ